MQFFLIIQDTHLLLLQFLLVLIQNDMWLYIFPCVLLQIHVDIINKKT